MSRCAFRPSSLTQPGGATFLDPDVKVSEEELNRQQKRWAGAGNTAMGQEAPRSKQEDKAEKGDASQVSPTTSATPAKGNWVGKVKGKLGLGGAGAGGG